MTKNYRRALNDITKVNELVDLAIKIQNVDVTVQSRDDLAFVLHEIELRLDHVRNQLVKGIEIERELEDLEEMTEKMDGVEIFVAPFIQEYPVPSLVRPSYN